MPKWPECNEGHKVTCGITPHLPGSNLNKGKDWPPERNYSSNLRAEVICYVTEKPIPSPTETESYLTVICSRCIVNRRLQEIWRASQHILSRTESVSKHYAEWNRGESGRHDGTCRLRLGMKNIYIYNCTQVIRPSVTKGGNSEIDHIF